MTEIFQNCDQNIQHVELSIAAHRMRFLGIADLLEHTIAGVQHRSVWPGLIIVVSCCCTLHAKEHNYSMYLFKGHNDIYFDMRHRLVNLLREVRDLLLTVQPASKNSKLILR